VNTNELFDARWYYSIELEPGVFTKGHDHTNIALTRKLLRNVQVRGKACIDIGTQEALIPILLKRAGAGLVAAYDRRDLTARIKTLRRIYQVDFHYLPDLQLRELPARLDRETQTRFFDLVVFSGVLYHLIDPFGVLALVRGLCKVGGLFLVETVAQQSPATTLIFNAKGQTYPGSHYFMPTTAWLDYALRMLGLKPLQAVYLGSLAPHDHIRVAILCRSTPGPCPADPRDTWAHEPWHQASFEVESQLDWKRLAKTHSDLKFQPYDSLVSSIDERGLTTCLALHPPYPEPQLDELQLSLHSQM
jgi:hypothetical protein